jgi:predicted HAD superfamily Cof-like phosphohydrolase
MTEFDSAVTEFNSLYGLAHPPSPKLPATRTELVNQLVNFRKILSDEVNEVDDILIKLTDGSVSQPDILTEIADWLGDLQVYCASEMVKYGLEPSAVLGIIMSSNMSKLGADGKPIIDEFGKVMKGPNYWKPEPMLKRYIVAAARQAVRNRAEDADDSA